MMQIFRDLEQGTPEWHQARAGIPTASAFKSLLAKGEGKTRKTYMYKLAGEIITGEPTENYSNGYMERGHALEGDARSLYAFMTNEDPEQVGFIRNGAKGCSPDSLIGANGMLEIKTQSPHLLIETLLADKFPSEHVAQCQGALWVAEREWIDLVIYYPGMPVFTKRATRDEAYIAELSKAVDIFNAELHELVAKIRKMGALEEAA
jgi:hypothetical protein